MMFFSFAIVRPNRNQGAGFQLSSIRETWLVSADGHHQSTSPSSTLKNSKPPCSKLGIDSVWWSFDGHVVLELIRWAFVWNWLRCCNRQVSRNQIDPKQFFWNYYRLTVLLQWSLLTTNTVKPIIDLKTELTMSKTSMIIFSF